MALSVKAKRGLELAMVSKVLGAEVSAAIDSGANDQAAAVAALGVTADLSTIAGTYAIPAEPTGAEVDATVQALADEVEARMDAIEAKVDELIAALKAASIMAS